MQDYNVINISLHVIKRCGMYSEEYKNWIARENEFPPIVETIDSFKEYWSGAIPLVKTAAPASQHGYGMAAVANNALIALYTETMSNFGAAYAATQDLMKSQSASLAAMQGQLVNIQQFCMTVSQQPPSNIYQLPSNSYASRSISAQPTTTEKEAEAEAAADTAVATNNQPGMVLAERAQSKPNVHPPPSSATKIGTTVSCTVATLTIPTQAKRV